MVSSLRDKYEEQMEKYAFQNALNEIFKVISRANKYIDENAPWVLAKDEAQKPRLARVLYNLLETVRICAGLLQPFMPDTAAEIGKRLGGADLSWDSLNAFGALPREAVTVAGPALFPRIDMEKELAELQDKFRSMKAKWENEKNAIGKVQSLREQIEQTNADIEKAQREYDLNKAAELKYGKLPQLQKQLEEEEKIAAAKKEDSLLRDRVTDEEIARIVARWTGIPVEKLVEGEREKLLHLDDVLHQRVIGQDEAVTKVSEAILRSRAGIANPNRPIGSFLFLGPTGVGKTELAKALAQALFDDERNMVRIDMTEYMEKFSVSRLIGAPPGYVGYEEGGQLTEAVRRKPYSVVLFDEVEKAHPDVFNILLQVLDDGRITDSQGRTVDFKNTVIILTSNLGSDIILNDLEQRRANGSNELSEEAKHQIDQLLKSKFRPEFLNRLDEIVYYKSLTKDEMRKIVDLQLQDLRKRMEEGKHLKLEVTTAAKDFIIDSAYDSVYGARPIKRFIQSRVETLIAKAIIQGSYTEGNTLTVDCENGALTLR